MYMQLVERLDAGSLPLDVSGLLKTKLFTSSFPFLFFVHVSHASSSVPTHELSGLYTLVGLPVLVRRPISPGRQGPLPRARGGQAQGGDHQGEGNWGRSY
jgi:hypothetical protein